MTHRVALDGNLLPLPEQQNEEQALKVLATEPNTGGQHTTKRPRQTTPSAAAIAEGPSEGTHPHALPAPVEEKKRRRFSFSSYTDEMLADHHDFRCKYHRAQGDAPVDFEQPSVKHDAGNHRAHQEGPSHHHVRHQTLWPRLDQQNVVVPKTMSSKTLGQQQRGRREASIGRLLKVWNARKEQQRSERQGRNNDWEPTAFPGCQTPVMAIAICAAPVSQSPVMTANGSSMPQQGVKVVIPSGVGRKVPMASRSLPPCCDGMISPGPFLVPPASAAGEAASSSPSTTTSASVAPPLLSPSRRASLFVTCSSRVTPTTVAGTGADGQAQL